MSRLRYGWWLLAFSLWAFIAAADRAAIDRLQKVLATSGKDALKQEATAELAKVSEASAVGLRVWLGRTFEELAEWDSALTQYHWLVTNQPDDAGWRQRRGAVRFRLGKVAESIVDFDAFLAAYPERVPYHWQRGISYYYAGEYGKGVKQFEVHETVNPRDVENAVFHFMCVSRLRGVAAARKELMATRGDPRVPMKQILALYAGTGTEAEVYEAVAEASAGSARESAKFYADLYVAIYHDLHGHARKALPYLKAAAGSPLRESYMGSVAVVHLELLQQRLKQSK